MATKKFYYQGKLMRTSQNHIYTHALICDCGEIDKNSVITCSATYDGCVKEHNRRISEVQRQIENFKAKVKALQNGKDGYWFMDGRRKEYYRFGAYGRKDTIEKAQENIDWYEMRLDNIIKYDKIVELEMR